MKLRMTFLLVAVAVAVAVVAIINPFESEPERVPDSPWFYSVSMDDIKEIAVNYQDNRIRFIESDKGVWKFEDPAGIPTWHQRWGGMTLLLSGPHTRRDLTPTTLTLDNLAQYGLEDPATIIDVGLTEGRTIQFRLGDKTTDGLHHYGQVIGFPQLFLIADVWGDVLNRLALEPPLPRWYIKRDLEEIVELNIFLGSYLDGDTPLLRFEERSGSWFVQDFTKDRARVAVDAERWAEVVPLLSGPPNVSVAESVVPFDDYTVFGITDDSNSIEIRYTEISDTGLKYNEGLTFIIGSLTPDQQWYYGREAGEAIGQPVLLLDVEWTDKLLALYDDIPYGEEPQRIVPADDSKS